MASIYDITFSTLVNNMLPPNKKKAVILAYFYVLVYPLQWVRDLFFNDYKDGAAYSAWSNISGYAIGTRVRFTDKANYECILGAFGNTQSPLNTLYWMKIQDNFIGANERIKYNSQIIVFEYALNKWFLNIGSPNQIFITNSGTSSQLLMGQTSAYSNTISTTSNNAIYYMGNAYVPIQYDFTINFPIALFNALPPTLSADKEQLIRNFADKYKLAGMSYNIITY